MSGNERPSEIWMDQDGGWEDEAALAILLRSPNVKVMGIAITPGIATGEIARQRVTMLLEALRERDAKIVERIPAGAEVLATGPLTRIAAMIASSAKPARVTWMGGAIRVKGNAKGNAEWNAAADAAALRTVLESQVPLTICPLDLTNRFPSDPSAVSGEGPVQRQMREAYREHGRFYWDELAAAWLAAPSLFKVEELKLKAGRGGKIEIGPEGRTVRVLKECDRSGFVTLLGSSLKF